MAAHVSVVDTPKLVTEVGMEGQFQTSLFPFGLLSRHRPALQPPLPQCQHSLASGRDDSVSQEFWFMVGLCENPVLVPLV